MPSPRLESRRSAVPSIEPSETTTSSTSSPGIPSTIARRIASTLPTISSPPLYTGTTTVRSGATDVTLCAENDADEVRDRVIRVHAVDGRCRGRPRFVEAAGADVERASARELGPLGDELEAAHLLGRDAQPPPELLRPRPVVAADVEQHSGRIRR